MKIYTTQEVAELLSIKENTVREYIKRGELEASRLGRMYRISEEQVNDFLEKTSTKRKEE